jgi:hypothetical protein
MTKKKRLLEQQQARFKQLKENSLTKPCGMRSKYTAGCRCDLCKEANRRYYHRNAIQRIQKGPILVDPKPAKLHVAKLRRRGLGLRWIAEQSGVSLSGLRRLIKENKSIKRQTAEKLLAFDGRRLKTGHRIGAAKCRQMVNQLIDAGFTKNQIKRKAKTQFPYFMDKRKDISPITAARISMMFKQYIAEP